MPIKGFDELNAAPKAFAEVKELTDPADVQAIVAYEEVRRWRNPQGQIQRKPCNTHSGEISIRDSHPVAIRTSVLPSFPTRRYRCRCRPRCVPAIVGGSVKAGSAIVDLSYGARRSLQASPGAEVVSSADRKSVFSTVFSRRPRQYGLKSHQAHTAEVDRCAKAFPYGATCTWNSRARLRSSLWSA